MPHLLRHCCFSNTKNRLSRDWLGKTGCNTCPYNLLSMWTWLHLSPPGVMTCPWNRLLRVKHASSTTARWNIFNFTKTSPVNYFSLFWHLTTCTNDMILHIAALCFWSTCCWFVIGCHFKMFWVCFFCFSSVLYHEWTWVRRWVRFRDTGWQWNWQRFANPHKSTTTVNDSVFDWIRFNTLEGSIKYKILAVTGKLKFQIRP